jgi:methionyl aminopeptidase
MIAGSEDLKDIRKAGKITALVIRKLRDMVKPGVTTMKLDEAARSLILEANGYPAFKNYKGFPGNICVSINEAVVHGIPSDRVIRDGDIVSLDIGVKFRDYFADAAITVGVGAISDTAKSLLDVTEKALDIGIANALSGRHISDVSAAIQAFVESNGFSIVRAFVGHGIGKKLHEEPEIPNYGRPGAGMLLSAGRVLAIELLEDGWTAVTKDRKLSAHFEHTVVVGDRKAEIITKI